MEPPTIVKQTKDYLLVKIPLPKQEKRISKLMPEKEKTADAEKRLREAEQDVREGRIITAPSLKEALNLYARKQWD